MFFGIDPAAAAEQDRAWRSGGGHSTNILRRESRDIEFWPYLVVTGRSASSADWRRPDLRRGDCSGGL